MTETVVGRNKTANEFVDSILAAMKQDPTISRVSIDMTDKVLRPFLHILDEAQKSKVPVSDVEDAVVGITATIIRNLLGRSIAYDRIDLAADKAEELMGGIANMLSESIAGSYTMPGQGGGTPH